MSTTLAAPVPASRGFEPREMEMLLSALAKDLLERKGTSAVEIEDGEATLIVMRVPHPVRVEKWSDVYPPELAAELERRCANLDQGRVLFEFTEDLDPADAGESKQ